MQCSQCQAEILDNSAFCSQCGTPTRSSGDAVTRTIIFARGGELASGDMLAHRYKILEMVGRGGMGIVYKAEDTKLHRYVALKSLPPELLRSEESRERFLIEARAAAALSHPNICTIHEIYDQEEPPFIEMEYVEGRSLRARIKDRPLEVGEAVDIAIQVADALEEAHQHGIVHRDVKSANILVTDKGRAKVTDFGLAKVKGETLHTREGTTLGTAAYMSPEQAQGEVVDQRTDVWSLGVVLYEMLSGQLPFAGEWDTAILYSVVHAQPKPLKDAGIPAELSAIASRALQKSLTTRYSSAAAMSRDLKRYRDSVKAQELIGLGSRAVLPAVRRLTVAVPLVVCVLALCAAAIWLGYRQSRIRWAKEQLVPEVERLILAREPGFANYTKAYRLAVEAERYVPEDAALKGALGKCAMSISIKTVPPGATVRMRQLFSADAQWRPLGVTPIEKMRLPAGLFWWKFEKQGFETVFAMAPTFRLDMTSRNYLVPSDLSRVLDPVGKIPPGMTRVLGATTAAGQLEDFFIDKYEVTNRQFKEFVGNGGYRERKYWAQAFAKEGRNLSWDEAMAEFRDQTGRPGPATWQAGDFPAGQADYPVGGVSWYEAAAYAAYVGKSLPTLWHWALAAGQATPLWEEGWLAYVSNFKGEGTAPIGSYPSMTAYGAFDMAGNVREWCWNETGEGRILRGGAWNDAAYMATYISQSPAFDRSPKNGFRGAIYRDVTRIPGKAFEPYEIVSTDFPNYRKQKPVPDPVFKVYKEQFSYDKIELNPHIEWRNESSADWVQEKVIVDAAYSNEKLPIYLFLPKGGRPPYQAVIYFPGAGSASHPSSKDLERYREFDWFLSFIVKNGRAVLYPIYKGTFERGDSTSTLLAGGAPTRQCTDYNIQLVKDLRRSIDYIETRPDIDSKKLAYLGYSWGARIAPMNLALEDRLGTGVLVVGGLRAKERPEVQPFNYVARVRMPILMLNGRYDMTFPYEASAKPLFDLLGTPPEHKRQVLYETDHFVPRNELIKETLAWLDRYLGPVK